MVNAMSTHVWFDSGATQSFVSQSLSKKFCNAPVTLDYLLEVKIVDDHTVSSSSVHRGCVLNLFIERYSIDLVSIPLRGLKVIIEIDKLCPNETMIDYERKIVRV